MTVGIIVLGAYLLMVCLPGLPGMSPHVQSLAPATSVVGLIAGILLLVGR